MTYRRRRIRIQKYQGFTEPEHKSVKASPNLDVFHRLRRRLRSTLEKPSGNARFPVTLLYIEAYFILLYIEMPGLRSFFRLALPLRPHLPVLRIRPTITSIAYSNHSDDSELRMLPSVLTERLDRHSQQLDKHDHQFEQLEKGITELKMDVKHRFHEMESKFQTILSQWLFRAATLVSPITSTFLTLNLMRYY